MCLSSKFLDSRDTWYCGNHCECFSESVLLMQFSQLSEIGIGNLVCSSSKFLDSKDTGYCYIHCKVFDFFKVSFAYEIVATF